VNLADRLAEGLRRLRQDANLTQKDMAKRLGLSHSTLHRVERGDYNTTLKVLQVLCEALDCRPGDLFEPGRLKLPTTRLRRRRRPG
jgi:transcriptional regulator with XRE-family HTH domain